MSFSTICVSDFLKRIQLYCASFYFQRYNQHPTMVAQTIYSRYISKQKLENLLKSLFTEGTYEWEVQVAHLI
jgi:hypothetical protein